VGCPPSPRPSPTEGSGSTSLNISGFPNFFTIHTVPKNCRSGAECRRRIIRGDAMKIRMTAVTVLMVWSVLSAFTPSCPGAQETITHPELKLRPTEPPTFASPEPPPSAQSEKNTQAKPAEKKSHFSWFWRIIGGIFSGAAKYNTDKQGDGRPNVQQNR
jgi:hypothetical protein